MSDAKAAKEEKPKKVEKKQDAGNPDVQAGRQTFQRQRGSKWNLNRCKKYARRFPNEEEWKKGAPSSYKAAAAKGWIRDCFPQAESASEPKKKRAKKAA
jgi:hypothetical protein